MDCSICCEKFNKTSRFKINCKSCESNNETFACRTCAKRYILDNNQPASCMVCNINWDTESLCEYFPKCFINKELKEHTENYLLEKQIALLPSTQTHAEWLKKVRELNRKEYDLKQKKKKLNEEMKEITKEIQEVQYELINLRTTDNNTNDDNKKVFTIKCPVESCNGFLDKKYNCGICENAICKDCMEIKEEEHVCNEEKKETVKFLKKDTKGCPTCGQLIYKIDGCDQMYCIKCHTAFSWKTGKTENGTVHNPEYYRWMRENGKEIPRNPLDIVNNGCNNNLPRLEFFLRFIRYYFPIYYSKDQNVNLDHIITIKLCNMHRLIHHAEHLNNIFNLKNNLNDKVFKNLRASYILNDISIEDFKVKLQRHQKQREKEEKINNVWALLRVVLLEYLLKISDKQYEVEEGKKLIIETLVEAENIRMHCNESFKKIGKMYGATYSGISKKWVDIFNWEKATEQVLQRTHPY